MRSAKKIKTILIDDEPSGINNLSRLLCEFCPSIEIIETISEKDEIKDFLSHCRNCVDLAFMDVQIGNHLIFDIINDIPEPQFEIIFVSAHDYALKSYKYNASNYILKPVDIKELIKTVKKVEEKIFSENIQKEFLEKLGHNYDPKPNDILLPTSNGYEMIALDSILYLIAQGSYTEFVIEGKKNILVSQNIKKYETKLSDHHFIRIHKSYIINLKKIKSISKADGGFVEMIDQKILQIAKAKKDVIFDKITAIT